MYENKRKPAQQKKVAIAGSGLGFGLGFRSGRLSVNAQEPVGK